MSGSVVSQRVPWRVLVALYFPPVFALTIVILRLVIEEANPEITVATFALLEQGLATTAWVLHLFGVAVLAWHSVARARSRLAPTWSMIPAFVYYALAVLVALTLRSETGAPIIWVN